MSSVSELAEKYGLDNYEDGTPILFWKKYEDRDDARTYTYTAVKGGGLWHCSDGKRYKWLQLCEEVARDNVGDKSLYEMSELETIWADPDVWGEENDDDK